MDSETFGFRGCVPLFVQRGCVPLFVRRGCIPIFPLRERGCVPLSDCSFFCVAAGTFVDWLALPWNKGMAACSKDLRCVSMWIWGTESCFCCWIYCIQPWCPWSIHWKRPWSTHRRRHLRDVPLKLYHSHVLVKTMPSACTLQCQASSYSICMQLPWPWTISATALNNVCNCLE